MQWLSVLATTIFGMTVKMYRPDFEALEVVKIKNLGWEFDHYAFKFLGTETEMYKILDVNYELYFEERGDLSRLPYIQIPVTEKV